MSDKNKEIQQFYSETHRADLKWEDSSYIYSWRNPIGFYIRWRIQHSIVKMLNKNSLFLADKRILDIGCGHGEWLNFISIIRGSSKGLVGLDVIENRIKKAVMINPGICFIHGDATSLPFAEQSFDIIMQFDCFEHFLDTDTLSKARDEVNRILKKDGLMIWYDLLPFSAKVKPINRGYSLEDVKSLFNEFELVYYEPIFKNFKLGIKTISTIYDLPRKKLGNAIIDFAERLPFGKSNNLLILMRKK